MKTISTGEPSTLKTYRTIALALSLGDENSESVKYIDRKIASAPHGENEVVKASESQMLFLLGNLSGQNWKKGE